MMLARTLLFMEHPAEAMDVVDAARAELPAEHERPATWRCARSGSSASSSASPTRRTWPSSRPGGAGPRGQGPGAKTLTAITSLAVAVPSGDARGGRGAGRRVARRRRDAGLRPRHLHRPAGGGAGDGRARPRPSREWRRIRALAGRRGSVLDAIGADLWGGLARIWIGDLRARHRAARARDGGRDPVRQRRQRAHGLLVGVPRARPGTSAATASGPGRRCGARGDRTGRPTASASG